MFKKIGKYIAKKVTGSLIGRVVKWGFWGIVLSNPVTAVGTVGVSGIVIGAATVHSGLIEYGASNLVGKTLED